MKFTAGFGTFEQYNWQGRGVAASADRKSGEPLAPNFSPMPGTSGGDAVELLESFKELGLDRFAGGVITDICLDDSGDAMTDTHIERRLADAVHHTAAQSHGELY